MGLKVNEHTHYHGLGKDLFIKVIDDLDSVTEAYRGTKNAEKSERRENYFLLISQHPDKDGNVINVPIYINEHGQYNRVVFDANKLGTVFGREQFRKYIQDEMRKGNLVRIKNRSIDVSEREADIATGYNKNASAISISDSTAKSQEKFSDREIAERDAAYMTAIENGDTETAQKMVDEAARNAGYMVKGYHGTGSDFNVFDKKKIGQGYTLFASQGFGFYFTESESVASNYAKGKRTVNAYLKTDNPFAFVDKNSTTSNNLLSEFAKQVGREFNIKDYDDFVSFEKRTGAILSRVVRENGKEFSEFLKEKGYDSVTYTSYDYDNNTTHKCYVIFDSNQIKSADPVTYDDNGDVIPLSKRFDSSNSDIRYSDRDSDSTSPRNLLANALEGTVTNDVERKKLAEYKNKIDLMNAEEEKLTELRKQIKEASFSKGKRDSAKLKQLKADATKTANRINT